MIGMLMVERRATNPNLICDSCGHKRTIDSPIKRRMTVAAKVFNEIDERGLYRLIKERLICEKCNARGQVKLFMPVVKVTPKIKFR